MQAVVKKPHIRIDADKIPDELISFLKDKYGEVEIITDPDEELIEIIKTEWYKNIKKTLSPYENMKLYRELKGWTQSEMAEKLGGIPRQNVSNMEHGRRSISKKTAKKLASLFGVKVDKFL